MLEKREENAIRSSLDERVFEVEQLNLYDEVDCWYKKRDYILMKPCDYTYKLNDATSKDSTHT